MVTYPSVNYVYVHSHNNMKTITTFIRQATPTSWKHGTVYYLLEHILLNFEVTAKFA